MLGRGRNSAQVIAHAASQRAPFWGGAICFDPRIKAQVLLNQLPYVDSYDVVERMWSDAERSGAHGDLLKKMTYVELKQRLAELLLMRVDRVTMATSVEARVPFLDHELVEFVLALPPSAKVRGRTGKWILRRAMAGILPDDVVRRPKQGFSAPIEEWFRGALGRRAQSEIRSSTLAERGLLDYDRIDRLWKAHRRQHANWAFQLWNLYTLSLWHDQWIAGRDRQNV
jgi:asparagine synthase (glutamine-hydrolysing)